jgi:drug/metabolite transporter (DMT)-like permease
MYGSVLTVMQRTNSEGARAYRSRGFATIIGVSSILQWGAQVLISTYATVFPPFQLIAMTFFIAFAVMLTKWLWKKENILQYARHGARVWIIGVSGLFGYYFVFYVALNHAPAIEVSLLVNLWPLLLVLFTGFLPGEKLRWYHIFSCLFGVAGSVVILGPQALSIIDGNYPVGHLLAIAAAIIWAAFCVASRTIGTVPTDTVGWYCLMTATLAALCHILLEPTVLVADSPAWWAVTALGVGPIGVAFFAWDIGMKRGNIRLLGVLAFFIPLLSAIFLVALGQSELDGRIVSAALLITVGALIAAKDEVSALIGEQERLDGR